MLLSRRPRFSSQLSVQASHSPVTPAPWDPVPLVSVRTYTHVHIPTLAHRSATVKNKIKETLKNIYKKSKLNIPKKTLPEKIKSPPFHLV